jgi:hypothetical protein
MVGGSLQVLQASSTTKTGRHDVHVAEILLKVALKHQKSIDQSCMYKPETSYVYG